MIIVAASGAISLGTDDIQLQLTAGSFGFVDVFGVVASFGLSGVLRQTPAATDLSYKETFP